MNPLTYLACFAKINHRRLNQLAAYFFNLDEILNSDYNELRHAGLEDEAAQAFIKWRLDNPSEKITEKLEREGIWTVALGEADYPALLEQIPNPPLALFVRGALPPEKPICLSVVGTRWVSAYGRIACEKIVYPLAEHNIVIVSGLALGLDTIAHETTLRAKGTTIAVLGGGVDRKTVAPQTNQKLSERIIATGGAVVSEYPPFYPPDIYTFPARNRIIAGLTQGTLVIEAPSSSGALITATDALDYNREVMSVPHQINSLTGAGCNMLIKKGAYVITSAEDVFEALGLDKPDQKTNQLKINLSEAETKILSILNSEPKHIDLLVEESSLSSSEVASATAMLEIKSQARNVGAGRYIKAC